MASQRTRSTTSSTRRSFAELGLSAPLVKVLSDSGITEPFPIQAATLPDTLRGRNVLGRGQTGSGKTYAFALPVLARLAGSTQRRKPGRPRALILAPTRELASQIEETIAPLAKAVGLTHVTIFGGVSAGPQASALRAGVDVVVACPGRLEDHLRSGHARLDEIEITVLDEADHMADLGFLPAVRRILDQTPRNGQRLLFSATLDEQVASLVARYVRDAVTHSVDSAQSPVSTMAHHVLHVRPADRFPVLLELAAAPDRTLVFTRTKHQAKRLTQQLVAAGVSAVELHGNLAQNARARNLDAFAAGSAKTLVATDIAARGIHVDDVTLVIHADPPTEHKAYLHRSGRTARAGSDGVVVTLMTDGQVGDVRGLLRKAAISATTSRVLPGDPLLVELAPGPRVFDAVPRSDRPAHASRPGGGSNGRPRRSGRPGAPSRGQSGGSRAQSSSASRSQSSSASRSQSSSAPRSQSGGSRTQSGGASRAHSGGAAAFSSGARPGRRRSR